MNKFLYKVSAADLALGHHPPPRAILNNSVWPCDWFVASCC